MSRLAALREIPDKNESYVRALFLLGVFQGLLKRFGRKAECGSPPRRWRNLVE